MSTVSALPEALLAVPELRISAEQADAMTSLGSLADVAQCADVQEIVGCTGLAQQNARALVSLWCSGGGA